MSTTKVSTPDQLRNALRRTTGIDDLDWVTPPTSLHGGFWAEMYTVELADPPPALAGPLVARIMPDPDTAAFETAIQRHVHHCGLPVPAIRGAPALYRRLPDLLAQAAADLHRCPTDGPDLDGHHDRADINAFLARIAAQADRIGRHDLAETGRSLADRAPASRVICHGDLHPFNVLVNGDRWTILDWSTAVTADPHYDLGFTTLMLANPPLGGPAPVRAIARSVGSRLAQRFLHTYQHLSGMPIDPERLAWGRTVHALRAMTEIATWEHQDRIDVHRGHPWVALRTVLEAQLATVTD